MIVRICLALALTFGVGISTVVAKLSFGPRPEVSLKNLTAKAESIFVGTVSSVEPANFKISNNETDELFIANNLITFAVESVLKGAKVGTVVTKGENLVLLYQKPERFLVFLHEENKDGSRFSPSNDVFPVINVISPDYHWEIGVRGGKRLSGEYGPYVLRFLMNEDMWIAGDTARWTSALKRKVVKELVALDSQFTDKKKADEVFSLTTRGCHWIRDEWDRSGGVGYIGWRPCPLPLAFVQAYIKVLVNQ